MRRLPPLNALRAFESAARHISFNGAAEELHVTPSAISHQVRTLEEFLGVKLFERLTRRVRLTSAGERFLPPIGAALAQIETAARQVGVSAASAADGITLSVTPSFAAEWLITRLSDFQARYPALEVRLLTDHRLPDFERGDIDLAIVVGQGNWRGLRSHKLSDEDVVPICSPRLLEGSNALREPDDLCRTTLIHVSNRPDRWPDWLDAARVDHPAPTQGPKLPSTALALEAAETGLGVALSNRLFVESHIDAGRLAIPFPLDFATGRGYYLVYPEARAELPAIDAFRGWLLALSRGTGTATTAPATDRRGEKPR